MSSVSPLGRTELKGEWTLLSTLKHWRLGDERACVGLCPPRGWGCTPAGINMGREGKCLQNGYGKIQRVLGKI